MSHECAKNGCRDLGLSPIFCFLCPRIPADSLFRFQIFKRENPWCTPSLPAEIQRWVALVELVRTPCHFTKQTLAPVQRNLPAKNLLANSPEQDCLYLPLAGPIVTCPRRHCQYYGLKRKTLRCRASSKGYLSRPDKLLEELLGAILTVDGEA
jgi:hypothetical protein